jgi:UDPglucose--hexose-1-phosphate uridylyltransferase
MKQTLNEKLSFGKEIITANFTDPSGEPVQRPIEIRRHPITFRSCRITLSRSLEKEAGTEFLPEPPPNAADTSQCPFCEPQVLRMTPRLDSKIFSAPRFKTGKSVLFPNLFPYGSYSAVSLVDENHFVEIGSASPESYSDCFKNAVRYLKEISTMDSDALYMALTQNHLPSAGGSLLHPHLQINADRVPSNHHRFLRERSGGYYEQNGSLLFSDYLAHERDDGSRYIGVTGDWEWMAAFAPEGFFEIWGILPGIVSIRDLSDEHLSALAQGVVNTQRLYRSLNRNGYNLGMLIVEAPFSRLELHIVLVVRSNHAPWVRNDHTGFEVMLGDMATFVAPEITAGLARKYWSQPENLET